MLNTKLSSQNHLKVQYKLELIKQTITRLLIISGLWFIVFTLLNAHQDAESHFPTIILCFFIAYALLDIGLMFYYLTREDGNA